MSRPLPIPAPVADIAPVDLTKAMSACPAEERACWDTLENVLHEAEGRDAFEIHFEPESDCLRVRFRSLFDFTEIRIEDSAPYLNALSRLQENLWQADSSDTARRGWFNFTVSDTTCLYQLDVVNSSKGPTYLLAHLDDSRKQPARLEDLGLNRVQLSTLQATLKKKNGLVVVAGEMSQARRRTSRAIAQSLVAPDMKVMIADTLVHPVIPRTTQLGMDFPADLAQQDTWNAMCRLGADAIVTAQTLEDTAARRLINQAAEQTLVVNSIAASSASGTLARLLGLGVRSETLAHCLTAVVLQHRVRCLCPYCRVPASPDDEGTAWLARYSPIKSGNINDWLRHRMRSSFSASEGCDRCNNTGTRNWLDIFEVLSISSELRDALYDADYRYAFSLLEQQRTLGTSLLKLAQEGIISLSEAVRLSGEPDGQE